MNGRTVTVSLIVGALVALTPAVSRSQPVADSSRPSVAGHEAAIAYFVAAYRAAPLPEKRGVHNDLMTVLSDPDFAFAEGRHTAAPR
ncbi:hypothetical protein [Terracoccus sp. 273MFTsu3.1]|uniref:hypothetical protein n=1 Tax=Terracoccus sp. 273MFTsu3.1 TaxID=1172188 RepID=UPI0012DF0B06|nr:hypothetical protein [Terracoccus sp. 273MFTsu3.1]